MDVGLLLLLNISSIPFVYEFESIGRSEGAPLSLRSVLRLQQFRHTRWAWGFAVLWLLFLALTLAPTRSGASHPAPITLVLLVLAIQVALWLLALVRVRQSHRSKAH